MDEEIQQVRCSILVPRSTVFQTYYVVGDINCIGLGNWDIIKAT